MTTIQLRNYILETTYEHLLEMKQSKVDISIDKCLERTIRESKVFYYFALLVVQNEVECCHGLLKLLKEFN